MKGRIFIVALFVSNFVIAQNPFIGINTNTDISRFTYSTNDLPTGYNFAPGIGILCRFEKKVVSPQVSINFDNLFVDYCFKAERSTSSSSYTHVDYYTYKYSASFYYMSIKPALYIRLTKPENSSSVYFIDQLYYGRMLSKNVKENITEKVIKEGSGGNYTYTTSILNSGAGPKNEREVLLSNNIGIGFDNPISERLKLTFSFFVFLPFVTMFDVGERTGFYFDETIHLKKQFAVNVSLLFKLRPLYSVFLRKANS